MPAYRGLEILKQSKIKSYRFGPKLLILKLGHPSNKIRLSKKTVKLMIKVSLSKALAQKKRRAIKDKKS